MNETSSSSLETSTDASVDASTQDFHHNVIIAAICIPASVIAFLGNTLVIIAVIVTKKLRTTTNILVISLAFADLFTAITVPFHMVSTLGQTRMYPLPGVVCAIVGGVTITCIVCSTITLATIAAIRWYVITRSVRGHQGIYAPKKITVLAIFTWILSVVVVVTPPVLGMGTFGYSLYYQTCFVTDTNPLRTYYIVYLSCLLALILTFTLLFYAMILHHVLRHNKEFRDKYAVDKNTNSTVENGNNSSKNRHPSMIKSIDRTDIAITQNLFVVLCFFAVSAVFAVANLMFNRFSPLTTYAVTLLGVNGAVNPFIYGAKHPHFREAFKRIICGHCTTKQQLAYVT